MMLQAYKWRFFWYLGVVLVAFGALGLPASRFVAGMLIPGVLHYLMQSFPIAIVLLIMFMFLDGNIPERTFRLRFKTIARIVIAIGLSMVGWGVLSSATSLGAIGITVMYWGGELTLLPGESQYWSMRRRARRGGT